MSRSSSSLVVLSVVDVPAEFYAEAPKAVEDMIRTAREYTAAVKKQAEALLAKVKAPGADFGALAKQFSEDEVSKANNGDLDLNPQ